MAYTPITATYMYVNVKDFLYQAISGELMSSGSSKVRVFTSDPLDHAYIPGIGINKVGLTEDGNSSGLGLVSQQPTYDPGTKAYTEYKGAFMQEAVEVRVFHHNADERDKLAILVLAVLFAIREQLILEGLRDITLSGGRDEQDNTLMNQPLFMHSLTMHYLNPLDVQVTTTVESVDSIDVTPIILK